MTKGQQAIRDLTRAMTDRTGNLPLLPGIFPDYQAPIVRNQPEGRELTMARWGMPSPIFALKGRNSDPGVTNVRNVASPHWRRWLGTEHRCLVPFTSFSEYDTIDGNRISVSTRISACSLEAQHAEEEKQRDRDSNREHHRSEAAQAVREKEKHGAIGLTIGVRA